MGNDLQHWGVPGMRWGVRRYQNKDGTLTTAGKKRYNKEMTKLKTEERTLKNKARTAAKLDKLETQKKNVEKLRGEEQQRVRKLSDDELREKIQRMELEKRYKDLMSQNVKQPEVKEKSSAGKKFVMGILENSAKNIGGQLTTYVMGKGVNALLADVFKDDQIVNPKKGQKDK